MLDVHRLRVFRAVVASGSVHAAATNLGYTASAVSQHVSALQRETGLVLMTRNGRGVEPTSAGLALATEIDSVLDRLSGVESFVADLREGRAGTLSVAYFASVGAAWMPAVVRALLRDFPGIRLDLSLRDDVALPDERVDVQIAVAPRDFRPAPGVRAVHLLDEPYVAVLPRSHPLAGEPAVDLARLAGDRWVDNDFARGWCRQNLVEACQAAGFSPPFHVEAHDYPTAVAFVDAGIGITVLPRIGAANLPPGAVAVPVANPTPERSIHALVQTAVLDTPPVRRALQLLQERIATTARS
ncbi:LysR family transcriptional regulator [Virgisporangium ochraceum]|uniref:LysR family transcriptional regulator n=1 Tax=Virgisporangium ochraceum TaxID=65505 RepID=A0A8J4EF71_9ACTN|nr:LysR family transcriptional regulator [Virgisporangium ochraceum]GIJ72373.1 LysR family transcriptional regulator [Virgisporangium ochraceum]